jgi:hypothetical protein
MGEGQESGAVTIATEEDKMAERKVKYGYMAVEMRPTSTGETTKILQDMNKLGDGGYRFVTVFHLPPDQAFILMEQQRDA